MTTSPPIGSQPPDRIAEAVPQDVDEAWRRCADSFCRFFTVRTGGDAHAADDLMQQLWLQARLHHAEMKGDNAEPWMWRIARNLLGQLHRTNSRSRAFASAAGADVGRRLAEQIDREEIPPEALAKKEVQEALLVALTGLPSEPQELLVGHYFEGRSHAELAESLGISIRALEGRLFRARARLREALGRMDEE